MIANKLHSFPLVIWPTNKIIGEGYLDERMQELQFKLVNKLYDPSKKTVDMIDDLNDYNYLFSLQKKTKENEKLTEWKIIFGEKLYRFENMNLFNFFFYEDPRFQDEVVSMILNVIENVKNEKEKLDKVIKILTNDFQILPKRKTEKEQIQNIDKVFEKSIVLNFLNMEMLIEQQQQEEENEYEILVIQKSTYLKALEIALQKVENTFQRRLIEYILSIFFPFYEKSNPIGYRIVTDQTDISSKLYNPSFEIIRDVNQPDIYAYGISKIELHSNLFFEKLNITSNNYFRLFHVNEYFPLMIWRPKYFGDYMVKTYIQGLTKEEKENNVNVGLILTKEEIENYKSKSDLQKGEIMIGCQPSSLFKNNNKTILFFKFMLADENDDHVLFLDSKRLKMKSTSIWCYDNSRMGHDSVNRLLLSKEDIMEYYQQTTRELMDMICESFEPLFTSSIEFSTDISNLFLTIDKVANLELTIQSIIPFQLTGENKNKETIKRKLTSTGNPLNEIITTKLDWKHSCYWFYKKLNTIDVILSKFSFNVFPMTSGQLIEIHIEKLNSLWFVDYLHDLFQSSLLKLFMLAIKE